MPLYINSNQSALGAQRALGINANQLDKSLQKLASGFRINTSADDAAGLQISEKLRAAIRGSQKALDNTQDGINVLTIADGVYDTITNSLQRIRELAVQGASDVNGADQRNAIKSELDQLSSEVDRIIKSTKVNGNTLLDGSITSYYLQVGADGTANDQINVTSVFTNNLVANLQVDTSNLSVNTTTNAQLTLNKLDTAITSITSRRATVGAFINRLQNTANNLQILIENNSSTEARIRNVDVASETTKLTSNQILQQAAASVLAQANQRPSIALELLK